jgi:tRNA modification GTPase
LSEDDRTLLNETATRPRLIVANKCDLPAATALDDAIGVSAVTGDGLEALRCALSRELGGGEATRESPALTNLRHISLLEEARDSLQSAADALGASEVPEEFLLTDLHTARTRFDEVVGARTSDDVLAHIFEKFCIGK